MGGPCESNFARFNVWDYGFDDTDPRGPVGNGPPRWAKLLLCLKVVGITVASIESDKSRYRS